MKFNGLFKGPSGVLIGLGIVVGGPLLVAAATRGIRPVAKAVFHGCLDTAGKLKTEPEIPDPEEVTVKQIRAWLSDTQDVADVEALLEAERSTKARKTAIEAIEARLSALTA